MFDTFDTMDGNTTGMNNSYVDFLQENMNPINYKPRGSKKKEDTIKANAIIKAPAKAKAKKKAEDMERMKELEKYQEDRNCERNKKYGL